MKLRPRREYPDLATYIAESGDPQWHVARRTGTSQGNISRIARGDSVPRPLLAMRLSQYCRIPLDSFARATVGRQKKEASL